MEERADPKLIALACAGDKEAFGILIARYQSMALRIAVKLTGNQDIARELVQEAMLQAYLSLDHLQDTARFKSWFYGIVLNVCRTYLRTHKPVLSLDVIVEELREEESALLGQMPDPQEEAEERELHDLMLQAVKQLSAKNRSVTLLFYYGQLSLREVASSLGISVVAVKSRLQQARKELRERLLLSYPEVRQIMPREQKRRMMRNVTIVEVIQQDPYCIVVLVDKAGQRALPIWAGYWEGQAIASTLQNLSTPGPLSFTFMANLLQASHSELEEVRIEALKEDTLYAITKIRQGNTVQEVEARPGDALALAAHTNSPISVAEDILEQLGVNVLAEAGKLSQQELDKIARHMKEKQATYSTTGLTMSGIGHSLPKHPLNLDGGEEVTAWIMGGSHAQNYESGFDRNVRRSGSGSFYLKAKVSQPGGSSLLLQMIKADEYRGKQVRFSGYVKAEAVEPRATICLYAYGPNTVLKYAAPPTPITGTQDWLPCEALMSVPDEAVRLALGMLLTGVGQVWFNELQFTVIDQSLSAAHQSVYAKQPQNLTFSQGTNGWSLFGALLSHYEYGVDRAVKHSSEGSLFLKGKVARPEGQMSATQRIAADEYRGKRVRFSGYVKAEAVEAWAALWMVIFGESDGMIFNSNVQQSTTRDLRIVGTQDWQPYEVVVDVPQASSYMSFGVGLMGRGQVWLDDVRFEVVGEDVPVTTIQAEA